jgi:argininosuccinate synthase
MWGVTSEGGEIENPALVPPLENILQVCRTPEKAINRKELITIDFVKGVPSALNDKAMKLTGNAKMIIVIAVIHPNQIYPQLSLLPNYKLKNRV